MPSASLDAEYWSSIGFQIQLEGLVIFKSDSHSEHHRVRLHRVIQHSSNQQKSTDVTGTRSVLNR